MNERKLRDGLIIVDGVEPHNQGQNQGQTQDTRRKYGEHILRKINPDSTEKIKPNKSVPRDFRGRE